MKEQRPVETVEDFKLRMLRGEALATLGGQMLHCHAEHDQRPAIED